MSELLRLLEKESEVAIKWLSNNNMIVNPKKFQANIINRKNRSNHNCCLTINNAEVRSKESVTLLGTKIDDTFNFKKHVSTIYKKDNNQLNAIRIGTILGKKEKETSIMSFIYSTLTTTLLYGTLQPAKKLKK